MLSNPHDLLSVEHKYPFSLFNSVRHSTEIKRIGNVEEVLDKSIGRKAFKISGSVSANNFIEFKNLHLVGNFFYVQLKALTKVSTFHIEVVTKSKISLRISLSSVFSDDIPRFFGRSLRLPIQVDNTKWTVISLDLESILKKFCNGDGAETLQFHYVKSVQLCSSALYRDIVTSNKLIGHAVDYLPRELATKSKETSNFIWYEVFGKDLTLENAPLDHSPKVETVNNPDSNSELNTAILKSNVGNLQSPEKSKIESSQSPLNQLSDSTQNVDVNVSNQTTPVSKYYSPAKTPLIPRTPKPIKAFQSPPASTSKGIVPPNRNIDMSKHEKVIRLERMLQYNGGPLAFLYGGSMALHSCGKSLVLSNLSDNSKSFDKHGLWTHFEKSTHTMPISSFLSPQSGKINSDNQQMAEYVHLGSCGHVNPISLIEVSNNEALMVTCESNPAKIILWDLKSGSRLCAVQTNQTSITAAAFSPDGEKLAIVGTDDHQRVHIVVWNVSLLVSEQALSNDTIASKAHMSPDSDSLNKIISDSGRTIAKQLSDFPISSITFSLFEENCLISCGRENIRFWRLRKKHLPGRPVVLGDYSRGYIFNQMGYYNIPGVHASDPRVPCVFFASNKGIVLKVDYQKVEIICSYQLHTSSITSFVISQDGFAVTGASDSKLRVWSLDFSDFLMEAQHEGTVSSVKIEKNGGSLLVGTKAGTVGVLKIAEHNYKTILRSHTACIHQISKRGSGEEFATVGADMTIRVWDLFSVQQKFEFSSYSDEPRSITYHPRHNIIACGFESGYVRIFDVEATSTLFEKKHHKNAITAVTYIFNDDSSSYYNASENYTLVTVSDSGVLVLYNAETYEPIKSIALFTTSVESGKDVRISYDRDHSLLAVSNGTPLTLCVLDTKDYSFILKSGQFTGMAITNLEDDSSPIKSPGIKLNTTDIFKSIDINECIKGLGFNQDHLGNYYLIVALKKHIIQINLPQLYYGGLTKSTSLVSSKRIDFGSISNMIIEPTANIAVLPVKLCSELRKKSSKDLISPDTLTDKFDLCLLGVKSRRNNDLAKIQLSLAQVFDDHPGSVKDAILCLAHGKVVSVDDQGSIFVWSIRHEKISRMQFQQTPPGVEDMAISTDAGIRRARVNESTIEQIETPHVNLEIKTDDLNVENAKNMINDFEVAVGRDPSMWSAATIDTMSPTSYRISDAYGTLEDFHSQASPSFAVKAGAHNEQVRFEDMFMNDEEAFLTSPRKSDEKAEAVDDYSPTPVRPSLSSNEYPLEPKELSFEPSLEGHKDTMAANVIVNEVEESPRQLSVNLPTLPEVNIDDGVYNQTPEKELNLSPKMDPNFLGSPLFSENPVLTFEDTDPFEEKVPSFRFTTNSNSVPPQFNIESRELLYSNGTSIILKNLNTLSDILLPRDASMPANLGNVQSLSFSPSGQFIVCVYFNDTAEVLDEDRYFLISWYRLSTSSGNSWKCSSVTSLRTPSQSSMKAVSLTWASILNSEVLSLSMHIQSSDCENLMVSVIPSSHLISSQVSEQLMRNASIFNIKSTGHSIGGSRTIPYHSQDNSCKQYTLAVWIGSVFYCYDVIYEEEKYSHSLSWTDDFGLSGPIVQVSNSSSTTNKNLSQLLILDSLGNVKVVSFHHILGIRGVALTIETSHIGGVPFSVIVSSIHNEVTWNAKLPSRMSKSVASITSQPSSSFSFSQVVIAHKFELKVYSLVTKETRLSSHHYLDVKIRHLYSIKTANIKLDFVTLGCFDYLPQRRDRFHLPSRNLFVSSEQSIVSAWDLDIISSNKEGFIGLLSVKPAKYQSTPQEVIHSCVIQCPSIFASNVEAFVNFGSTKKHSAYIDSMMKLSIVENIRRTKVQLSSMFDTSILKAVTSVAGCSHYLAVGSSQGQVVLLDGLTVSPICQFSETGSHDLTHADSLAISVDSTTKTIRKSVIGMPAKPPIISEESIKSLMFVRNGKSIVSVNSKNEVSILYVVSRNEVSKELFLVKFSVPCSLSTRLKSFQCYRSSNIFGIFEHNGQVVEIFRARSSPKEYDPLSAVTALGKFTFVSESNFITIFSAHAMKIASSNSIAVFVHGMKEGSEGCHGIYRAEIALPYTFGADDVTYVNCREIIYLVPPLRCYFSEHLCGVVEQDHICAYDLNKYDSESMCIYDLGRYDSTLDTESFSKSIVCFEHLKSAATHTDSIQILFAGAAAMIQTQLSS